MKLKEPCYFCGKVVHKRPCYIAPKGRPWKRTFCNSKCYAGWRRIERQKYERELLKKLREVWGTIPAGRFEVQKARQYGKRFEAIAEKAYLPQLGFTDVVNLSSMSNQFFVDFVATCRNKRVLVDITIKLNAYVPEKIKLADALHMQLYILHVSPKTRELFYLRKMPKGQRTSKVPAKFLRSMSGKDL